MKKNGDKAKEFFAKLKRICSWPIITKTKSGTPLQSNGRFRIKAIDQLTSSKSIISDRLVIKGFLLAFSFTMIILGGLAGELHGYANRLRRILGARLDAFGFKVYTDGKHHLFHRTTETRMGNSFSLHHALAAFSVSKSRALSNVFV